MDLEVVGVSVNTSSPTCPCDPVQPLLSVICLYMEKGKIIPYENVIN